MSHYDEKKFLELLSGVDSSLHKIKQIANYMIFFRESYSDKIIDAWCRQFHSVAPELKLLLIYVVNEVIFQTSRKSKLEYVRGFADQFIDCFKDLIKSTENLEILSNMIKLCDMWENELIYANNFMELLRRLIKFRMNELQGGYEELKNDSSANLLSDFKLINRWEICNHNFTLDLQEENIKGIYESVDKDKLNSLLSSGVNSENKKEITEYEEKLKELRKLLITDLANREKFIINLGDFISKEKEIFFSNLEKNQGK